MSGAGTPAGQGGHREADTPLVSLSQCDTPLVSLSQCDTPLVSLSQCDTFGEFESV